jgi:hypothetical protein
VTPLAHGIGGIRDLPVPGWLFFWGAAIVLAVSFLALAVLWKEPLLQRLSHGRALPRWFATLVLGRPLRVAVQAVSVALFVLVLVSALVGDAIPASNLAPTWVYVVFWLGVPLLSVLFGDVWRALSPWRAIADFSVWVWELTGREAQALWTYPAGWGRIPAAFALFAFAELELAYVNPDDPRILAVAILVYTYWALFGFVVFGREEWTRGGEGFAVLFSYLARIAPFGPGGGKVVLRVPLSGLAGSERTPAASLFLAVMLGSVAFDGMSRTSAWQDVILSVRERFLDNPEAQGDLAVTLVSLAGLVTAIAIVWGAFALACVAAQSIVNAPRSLRPEFVLSLVPIALAYEVAHYFSLFVIQGQFAIPLLSDPLGRGWDLLGTAGFTPNVTVLAPNTIWYVQVAALVIGHVAGLAVAHDRAVAMFPERRQAVLSQYPLLGLMVLYTLGGMWLLSQP